MQLRKMEEADESVNSPAPNLPLGVSGSARNVGDLCYDLLSRYGLLSLLLLLALVFARSVCGSQQKALWNDEIYSVIVATQPTWHKFAQAMPSECNPPLYPLLARLAIRLFGLTDLSVRMPDILSFLAALAGVYVFVRRECGVVFGLLAVVLIFSEPGWTYSFEARPYGLLLAFLMLALVSWQSAANAAEATPRRPRRLALVGIVIGIVGSIFSHGIGVVEVGVPLLFGEAVRLHRTRRPDWPILATALSASPALAIILPMMRRTRDLLLIYSRAEMHPLTLAKLHQYWIVNPKSTLNLILNPALIEILATIVFVAWAPRWLNCSGSNSSDRLDQGLIVRPSAHAIAAALGASLLIPATMLAMMSSTGYYNCRYGIGSIAGIAMLACLLIGRAGRRQSTICLSLFAFLLLSYTHGYISAMRHPPGQADAVAYVLSSDQSDLPIVISDPFNYIRVWWYAPASVKDRFIYLSDEPTGIQHDYLVPEVALVAEKPLISARLEDYAGFLSTHDHFLLDTDADDRSIFLKARLEGAGYRSTLQADDGFNHLYDMQRTASTSKINRVKTNR